MKAVIVLDVWPRSLQLLMCTYSWGPLNVFHSLMHLTDHDNVISRWTKDYITALRVCEDLHAILKPHTLQGCFLWYFLSCVFSPQFIFWSYVAVIRHRVVIVSAFTYKWRYFFFWKIWKACFIYVQIVKTWQGNMLLDRVLRVFFN